ncbi:MAG: polysaccharide biosynthesis C-terminal domain-containing protein [Planctomycetota bacterium]
MAGYSMGFGTGVLLLFSLGGFVLTYGTSIILAREMGASGYDNYAVAIAAASILSTLAEMGAGKYAMRVIPAYVEHQNWGRAKGYCRYAVLLILGASIILAAVAAWSEGIEAGEFRSHVVGIVVLFLPVMALVGYGAEVVMANGAPLRASFVTRLIVPGVMFVAIAASAGRVELTAEYAVFWFGAGWLIGLVLVWIQYLRTADKRVRAATAIYEPWYWLKRSSPFLAFALLISMMSKIGVVVLEGTSAAETEVAIFSVALDTGSFIYIVSKSTDKLFLPSLSVMIERQDREAMLAIGTKRRRLMRWFCAVFLLIIFTLGRTILGVFGEEFVSGFPALCIVSVATCVWTYYSLVPSFLKYIKMNTFVVRCTAICVAINIGLVYILGPRYGATGAAIAYGVSVTTLYLTFARVGQKKFGLMGEKSDTRVASSLMDIDAEEFNL